jgi:hypothetical protein
MKLRTGYEVNRNKWESKSLAILFKVLCGIVFREAETSSKYPYVCMFICFHYSTSGVGIFQPL